MSTAQAGLQQRVGEGSLHQIDMLLLSKKFASAILLRKLLHLGHNLTKSPGFRVRDAVIEIASTCKPVATFPALLKASHRKVLLCARKESLITKFWHCHKAVVQLVRIASHGRYWHVAAQCASAAAPQACRAGE